MRIVYLVVNCLFIGFAACDDGSGLEETDDLTDILGSRDDQVDRWEAIPLPPPSEADLIRDSDELYSMNLSEVKRILEQEESMIRAAGGFNTDEQTEVEAVQAELEAIEDRSGREGNGGEYENMPFIFNTDDFDDDFDDVPGDAPLAPPLK